MDRKLWNVLLLSLGFFFVFTAFTTLATIQKVVLDSIHRDNPTFTGDGYISLSIVYVLFAICSWLAPSLLLITGDKWALVFGAVTYGIFVVSFMFQRTWFLYAASALLGAGAAVLWAGQGSVMARLSDQNSISRNSGIFWAIWQSSGLFGNLFVFYKFLGHTHIEEETRQTIFSVLIGVLILGLISLGCINGGAKTSQTNSEISVTTRTTLPKRLASEVGYAVKLFITRDVLLLSSMAFYIGLVTSFQIVMASSVGFTLAFAEKAKYLVGLCGVFTGSGQVVGGIAFGLLGKTTVRFGRAPVVALGCLFHLICYAIVYVNLPHLASLGETTDHPIIGNPIPQLVLLCTFLLGVGDSCMNTQMYTIIAGTFNAKSAISAFVIYRFFVSFGAGISFVYSSYCTLRHSVIILAIGALMATTNFSFAEKFRKRSVPETLASF